MTDIKTDDELSAILSAAAKAARLNPAIDAEIRSIQWASSGTTWLVYAASEFRNFNAFCFDSETGQVYEMRGGDPKPIKRGSETLMPATKARRGKPIGTRNILTDAAWVMENSLATHGSFIKVTARSFSVTVDEGGAA